MIEDKPRFEGLRPYLCLEAPDVQDKGLTLYLYTNPFMKGNMATAKTGSFYLTETVTIPGLTGAGQRRMGTIDLGAYVNVATGQAVAVESVDFIIQQGDTYSQRLAGFLAGDGSISMQLTDLNTANNFVRADNHSLIASGALNVDDSANLGTETVDFYPDNFGPAALSEAYMVVNDSLYLTVGIDGNAVQTDALHITVRIKARIVKLSNKDFVAIAIQSTASDN